MFNDNNNSKNIENIDSANLNNLRNQINELRKLFNKSRDFKKNSISNDEINKDKILNNNENKELVLNHKFNKINKTDSQKSKQFKILDNLENEINLLVLENSRLREDRLKALANLENAKKAMNIEILNIRKYRASTFAKNFLPILDNFQRALSFANYSPEVKNFLLGFQMIMKNIETLFNEEGIKEISTKIGDTFDSDIHSGIEITETKLVKSGSISKILEKGYRLHDRIIRPVLVNIEK